MPLLAMAYGVGNNYGVLRPGTFNDPAQMGKCCHAKRRAGYHAHFKTHIDRDWWYLAALTGRGDCERGVEETLKRSWP